jgi:hypothetical protein
MTSKKTRKHVTKYFLESDSEEKNLLSKIILRMTGNNGN